MRDDVGRINLIRGDEDKTRSERAVEGSMARTWQEGDEGGLPPPACLLFC